MDVMPYTRARCPSDSQSDEYYPIEFEPIKALFGKALATSASVANCYEKRQSIVNFDSNARVESERRLRVIGDKTRSRSISSGPESGIGSDSDSILETSLPTNISEIHVTELELVHHQHQQQQHQYASYVRHTDASMKIYPSEQQHRKMTEVASYITTPWKSGQLSGNDGDAQRYFHPEALQRQDAIPQRHSKSPPSIKARGNFKPVDGIATTPSKVIKSNSSTAVRSKTRQLPRVPAIVVADGRKMFEKPAPVRNNREEHSIRSKHDPMKTEWSPTKHGESGSQNGLAGEMFMKPPSNNRSLSVEETTRRTNGDLQLFSYHNDNLPPEVANRSHRREDVKRMVDTSTDVLHHKTYRQEQCVRSASVNGNSMKEFDEVDRYPDSGNMRNGFISSTARSTSIDSANANRGEGFIAAENVSQIRRACQQLVREPAITSSTSKITRSSTNIGSTSGNNAEISEMYWDGKSYRGNRGASSTQGENPEKSSITPQPQSTSVRFNRLSEGNTSDSLRYESTGYDMLPENSVGSTPKLLEDYNGSSTSDQQQKGSKNVIHYEKLYQLPSKNHQQQHNIRDSHQIQLNLQQQRLRQLQQSYAVSVQVGGKPTRWSAVSSQKSSDAQKLYSSATAAKPPSGKQYVRTQRSLSVPVPEFHHSTKSICDKRHGSSDITNYRQHSTGASPDFIGELASYKASTSSPPFLASTTFDSAAVNKVNARRYVDSSPAREVPPLRSVESPAEESTRTADKHRKSRERPSIIRRLFSQKSPKKVKPLAVLGDAILPPSTLSGYYNDASTAQMFAIHQSPARNSQGGQALSSDLLQQLSVEQTLYPREQFHSSSVANISSVDEFVQATDGFVPDIMGTTVFGERSLPLHFSMSPRTEPLSSRNYSRDETSSGADRVLETNQTTSSSRGEFMNDFKCFTPTPLPTRVASAKKRPELSETSDGKRKNGKNAMKTTSFINYVPTDDSDVAPTTNDADNSMSSGNNAIRAKPPAGSRSPIRKSLNRILRLKSQTTLPKLKMTNQARRDQDSTQGSQSNEIELSSGFRPRSAPLSTPNDSTTSPNSGSPHTFMRFRFDSSVSETSLATMASLTTSEEDKSVGSRSESSPVAFLIDKGAMTPSSSSGGSMPSTPMKNGVNVLQSLLSTPSATPTRGARLCSPFSDAEALEKVRSIMNPAEEMIVLKLYTGLTGFAEAIADVEIIIGLLAERRDEDVTEENTAENPNLSSSREKNYDCAGDSSSEQDSLRKWNEAVSLGVNYEEVKTKMGSAGRHFIAGCKMLVTSARDTSSTSLILIESFNSSLTETVRAFVVLLVRCRQAVLTFGHHQGLPLLDSLANVAGEYLVTLTAAYNVVKCRSSDKALIKEMMLQTNKLAESLCVLMKNIKLIKREIAYL